MTTLVNEPSQPLQIRLAVIGGGITGLSAAHRLIELAEGAGARVRLSLFEKSHRPGGVFGSGVVGDYLIERGADSFITNKPAAINLCRRLGLEEELISTDPRFRRSLILFRGRPVPTPVGFNLLAPAQIRPMLTTPLLSWKGKIRLLQERFIPRRRSDEDESLADFVRRRFGSEMLERIVQPMVGGIYTSDPEKLSLKATLPRFLEMERRYGSLIKGMLKQKQSSDSEGSEQNASGARYGLFVSLKKGMQQLIDALEQRISAYTFRRHGPEVTGIHKIDSGWQVTTTDGQLQEFDGVIVALPAPIAARLMQTVDADVARTLAGFEYASSAIVVSGHNLSDSRHPLDAFGLVIPHCERRRILATSFLSRKFPDRAPAGKVILRTFVGGAMQPEEFEQSDEQMVQTVLSELNSIFGLGGVPDFVLVNRYPRGMPQFHVGHLDRVQQLEQQVESISGLKLAGNYFRGVGLPDCVQSGEQAAEALWEQCCSRGNIIP